MRKSDFQIDFSVFLNLFSTSYNLYEFRKITYYYYFFFVYMFFFTISARLGCDKWRIHISVIYTRIAAAYYDAQTAFKF